MTPELWQKVKDLYEAAQALPALARAGFLASSCDDPALRAEVETLLAADRAAADDAFLEADAVQYASLSGEIAVPQLETLGHYRVIQKIGEGGMGSVYLAEDLHLSRKVALKLLAPHLMADASAPQRLRREAKAASALNHPNIITIFDVGEDKGTHYIASEYIEGQTVREKLRAGPVAPLELRSIALQAAAALEAAHEAGFIHRDLKPENLMVRKDGLVKLLDFGIARHLELDPESGASGQGLLKILKGTPKYMSPEQARRGKLDRRTDIYSLALVIYEMADGEHPFERSSAPEWIEGQPVPVPIILRTPLDPVLRKALARDPKDRYQTMKEFTVAIDRATRPRGMVRWAAAITAGLVALAAAIWFLVTRG